MLHNGNVRILLVEDESRVAGFIARGLREQSYAVDIARDGEQGLYLATARNVDGIGLFAQAPGDESGYSRFIFHQQDAHVSIVKHRR